MKPTAANVAAAALLALHATSLFTIPPLAVNVVVTATAIVFHHFSYAHCDTDFGV